MVTRHYAVVVQDDLLSSYFAFDEGFMDWQALIGSVTDFWNHVLLFARDSEIDAIVRSTTVSRSRATRSTDGSRSSTRPSTPVGRGRTRTGPRSGRPGWRGPSPSGYSDVGGGDRPTTGTNVDLGRSLIVRTCAGACPA